MNLQPLYNVKTRLEQAAIAGVGLLGEDFRLRRAAEGLEPLAAASPVFGKINAGLDKLLSAAGAERSGLLLDLLALVDAVACTQAKTGAAGELEPLPAGHGQYQELSYSQLQPLLSALTGTGGGRMGQVKDTWEAHPEFFGDFRVLPALVAGLGESYADLAQLNVEILKTQGVQALPLLKEGFDPAGKKEMARRVEVIAALEGAKATPWLREVLPQSKKDVRGAVIAALGADPENIPLLLDLSKTERGANRDAVLTALSRMDGEAIRNLWQNELAKHPDHVSFLQNSSTEWAAELVAEGMRSRLEYAMYERRIVTREMKTELQQWCAALRGGKASPAMLDFWRWVDGHFDDIRRLESVGNSDFRLTSHMTTRLMESLCAAGSGPLSELCLELWEKDKDSPRWLSHAVAAALMTRPATEVYDEFAPYVPTSMPLLGMDHKKELSDAVIKGLTQAYWSESLGCYLFRQGSHAPAQPLDSRWISRLVDAVWKSSGGENRPCYAPFGSGETVEQFEITLIDLVNPEDPEACALLVPYLRRRMVETGSYYTYSQWLLRYHGQFLDILPQSLKSSRRGAYLYYIWQLFHMAAPGADRKLLISSLEGVLDSGGLRMEDAALAHAAVSYTVSLLQDSENAPFPEWEEWWALR